MNSVDGLIRIRKQQQKTGLVVLHMWITYIVYSPRLDAQSRAHLRNYLKTYLLCQINDNQSRRPRYRFQGDEPSSIILDFDEDYFLNQASWLFLIKLPI